MFIFINKFNRAKIVFVVLALIFSFSLLSFSEIVEQILAKIEGRIFTQSDFEIAKTFKLVEIVYDNEKNINDDLYLSNLIDSELIYREGTLMKITEVSNEDVNKELALIKENMGTSFKTKLDKYQISEENLKNLIREKLLAKKYFDVRKNFFNGFGEENGKSKMQEWLTGLRKKAGLKIIYQTK